MQTKNGSFRGVSDDEKAGLFRALQRRDDENVAGALVWLKRELGRDYVEELLER